MAKVDILLPYWGEFKLLKKAVDSVLAQTEQDWRLLIIDDCYPSEEAKAFYSDFPDKRVSYYRHENNLGLVKNFGFALSKATAKHCMLLGCDDMLLPTYLEKALIAIEDADFYQPGVLVIDDIDNEYLPMADKIKRLLRPNKPGFYRGEKIATTLCTGNWLYFPSILWKTSTLLRHGFDEDKKNTQDLAAALNILIDGGTICISNEKIFLYRRSNFSFSSKAKNGTRFSEEAETYAKFADKFQEIGWRKASFAAKLHLTARLHRLLS